MAEKKKENTKEKKTADSAEEIREELGEKAREVWLAGLGALATVEEEGSKLFKNLVNRGQDLENRGSKTVEDLSGEISEGYKNLESQVKDTFEKASEGIDETVSNLARTVGVPTRDEIKDLNTKLDELTKKVDQLSKKVEGSGSSSGSGKSGGTTGSSGSGGSKS